MKPSKVVIILLLVSALPALSQVVTVNDKPVDLTPLTNWLAHPAGERPLKHWKLIQICSIGDSPESCADQPCCAVKDEEGTQFKVLLLHPPQPDKVTKIISLQDQIAKDEQREKSATDELAASKELRIKLDNGATGTISDGSKERWERLMLSLNKEREQLRKLLADYLGSSTTNDTLAMFTGKTSPGGLPIWDCGKRQEKP